MDPALCQPRKHSGRWGGRVTQGTQPNLFHRMRVTKRFARQRRTASCVWPSAAGSTPRKMWSAPAHNRPPLTPGGGVCLSVGGLGGGGAGGKWRRSPEHVTHRCDAPDCQWLPRHSVGAYHPKNIFVFNSVSPRIALRITGVSPKSYQKVDPKKSIFSVYCHEAVMNITACQVLPRPARSPTCASPGLKPCLGAPPHRAKASHLVGGGTCGHHCPPTPGTPGSF